MNDALDIVQISECGTELCENIPDDFFFDAVLFLRLRQNVIGERNAIKQLHDDVNVLSVGEGCVISGDVGMVQVFQNRHFFADFFHQQLIC